MAVQERLKYFHFTVLVLWFYFVALNAFVKSNLQILKYPNLWFLGALKIILLSDFQTFVDSCDPKSCHAFVA